MNIVAVGNNWIEEARNWRDYQNFKDQNEVLEREFRTLREGVFIYLIGKIYRATNGWYESNRIAIKDFPYRYNHFANTIHKFAELQTGLDNCERKLPLMPAKAKEILSLALKNIHNECQSQGDNLTSDYVIDSYSKYIKLSLNVDKFRQMEEVLKVQIDIINRFLSTLKPEERNGFEYYYEKHVIDWWFEECAKNGIPKQADFNLRFATEYVNHLKLSFVGGPRNVLSDIQTKLTFKANKDLGEDFAASFGDDPAYREHAQAFSKQEGKKKKS